jgi:hypothetical protein
MTANNHINAILPASCKRRQNLLCGLRFPFSYGEKETNLSSKIQTQAYLLPLPDLAMNFLGLFLLTLFMVVTANAFVVVTPAATNTALSVSSQELEQQEQALQCFVVNFDMVQEDGETPEVFCTSEPEEFAWFHGMDLQKLKSTDIIKDEAFQECVEGASPRGIPEWECKVGDDW